MSAAKGKAVAVALVGVGAIAAFGFSGSAHAAEPEEKKKPAPSKAKVSRVTLAVKYAKVFGVPASLVLAAISVGRMSLKTAKDIWPKAAAKIGKTWDGTAQGLKDDAISIGLSAYYLGLWWKRYKKNPRQWILAGYAYILGPGRVRKVLPNDAGTLPKPLPADFVRVKASFAKALTKPEVKKALAQEKRTPALSGAAPLYGKALANTIPAETTGYGARKMFGEMTQALANAYSTLQSYDPNRIAERSGIDAGSVKAARDYLDSTNAMLAKYYKQMPESSNKLTADQLNKLKVAASTSSVAVKTVNDLFGTSWAMELTKEIGKAAVEVPKQVLHGAAEAVGLDKTSAAIAVAGIIGAGVLVLAIKK
ncbi:MAG: hypothetical protein PHS34_08740 [Candidatus Omnitrophica bacterium]|nr:hypothetical protein [Candidatus Omnitrophota bacterium]